MTVFGWSRSYVIGPSHFVRFWSFSSFCQKELRALFEQTISKGPHNENAASIRRICKRSNQPKIAKKKSDHVIFDFMKKKAVTCIA